MEKVPLQQIIMDIGYRLRELEEEVKQLKTQVKPKT